MLLVRADAGSDIGTGHVMRCIALAEAWRRHAAGTSARFVLAHATNSVEELLRRRGFEVDRPSVGPGSAEDAAATADLARRHRAEAVVLDGYHFGVTYQRIVARVASTLLICDGDYLDGYATDLLLDQNVTARPETYLPKTSGTVRFLLGPRYVLLRDEYRRWRDWRRPQDASAHRVLITMGGADAANVTGSLLESVVRAEPDELALDVVVGPVNDRYDDLRRLADAAPIDIRIHRNVPDMAELIARVDIAVTAAGSTLWELLYMQTPSVAFTVAPNQAPVADRLAREGYIVVADGARTLDLRQVVAPLLADPGLRAALARRGRALIDGLGADRVAADLATESKLGGES